MKVLFLCKANVSRSQMAAAIYNQMTNSHDADSAGVNVDVPNETLAERKQRLGASNTLDLMREAGFDLAHNKRTQLTKNMVKNYDRVISMYDEDLAPSWLKSDPRYEYWDITDPFGKDMNVTRETKEKITAKIQELI